MKVISILAFCILLFSCVTTDLEKKHNKEKAQKEAENADTRTEEEILVERLISENDIEKSVVYVASPEIIKSDTPSATVKKGSDAVKENWKERLILPESENKILRAFRFSEDDVFEIHCQTYHITDVVLEIGETITDTPFCSETDLWEIGTATREVAGEKQMHLMLKPSRTGMSSSILIMTDRRCYHIEAKSFNDHFMPVVRWVYPKKFEFNIAGDGEKKVYTELGFVETEFISFDYRMKSSAVRRPSWLPKSVYDDGRRTYFVLDERTLHTKMPALFDKKKNLINYRVKNNILIVDELIDKVTLKVGKEKVTVEKKKGKEAKNG